MTTDKRTSESFPTGHDGPTVLDLVRRGDAGERPCDVGTVPYPWRTQPVYHPSRYHPSRTICDLPDIYDPQPDPIPRTTKVGTQVLINFTVAVAILGAIALGLWQLPR